MKTAILLLFAFIALVRAEEKIIPFDTLTVGVKTYTNCTVKALNAAEAMIRFEGGGAKVKTADLPAEAQQSLGYSSTTANAYFVDQKKKQEAFSKRAQADRANLAASEAPIGEPKNVRILKVINNYGFPTCSTDAGTIAIAGLPASIDIYYKTLESKRLNVIQYADELETKRKNLDRLDAITPTGASGNAAYVDAVMAKRTAINLAYQDLKEESTKLTHMSEAWKDMQSDGPRMTTISAQETGKAYGGCKVWNYVGPAILSNPAQSLVDSQRKSGN